MLELLPSRPPSKTTSQAHEVLEIPSPSIPGRTVTANAIQDSGQDSESLLMQPALLEQLKRGGSRGASSGSRSSSSTTTTSSSRAAGDDMGDAKDDNNACSAAAAALLPSPRMRMLMVVLFTSIITLLSADQNLLAPNLSAAADYFGLDAEQKDVVLGGYLMAAFFLVGAPAALVCGWLADKLNRVKVLFVIILLGQAPCLATYWVTALWQFFLLRMLTGIAVGGCFPLVFSLLGDLFPTSRRAAVSAGVQIAIGLGLGGGQMLSGLLGPATNWRLPFVLVSAPTIALGLYMVLAVHEPPRGVWEPGLSHQLAAGEVYSEKITWGKVRCLLQVTSNWLIITQGLPGSLPWGVMQTYLNDYLSTEKGFSVPGATAVILVFGLLGGVGVVAGGAAGQWVYNRRKYAVALLSGGCVLLGTIPVLLIINGDLQKWGIAPTCAMAGLAGFLASVGGPNIRAMVLNVNSPETRGVAIALQSVTDDLGKGIGPVIVAAFITKLGRLGAFNLSVLGWIPCGLIIMLLGCYLARDEARLQASLASRSEAALAAKRRLTGSPSDGRDGSTDLEGGSSTAIQIEGGTGGMEVRARAVSVSRRATDTVQQLAAVHYSSNGPEQSHRHHGSWPGCGRSSSSSAASDPLLEFPMSTLRASPQLAVGPSVPLLQAQQQAAGSSGDSSGATPGQHGPTRSNSNGLAVGTTHGKLSRLGSGPSSSGSHSSAASPRSAPGAGLPGFNNTFAAVARLVGQPPGSSSGGHSVMQQAARQQQQAAEAERWQPLLQPEGGGDGGPAPAILLSNNPRST